MKKILLILSLIICFIFNSVPIYAIETTQVNTEESDTGSLFGNNLADTPFILADGSVIYVPDTVLLVKDEGYNDLFVFEKDGNHYVYCFKSLQVTKNNAYGLYLQFNEVCRFEYYSNNDSSMYNKGSYVDYNWNQTWTASALELGNILGSTIDILEGDTVLYPKNMIFEEYTGSITPDVPVDPEDPEDPDVPVVDNTELTEAIKENTSI